MNFSLLRNYLFIKRWFNVVEILFLLNRINSSWHDHLLYKFQYWFTWVNMTKFLNNQVKTKGDSSSSVAILRDGQLRCVFAAFRHIAQRTSSVTGTRLCGMGRIPPLEDLNRVKVEWFLRFFSYQPIFKWLDRVATDGRSVALLVVIGSVSGETCS